MSAPAFELPAAEDPVLDPADAEEGAYYYMVCRYADDGTLAFDQLFEWTVGENVITPESLAAQAQELLEISFPEPRTSPRRSVDQIVGLDTWMWLDPGSWTAESETASVPGLSVTATAEPTRVTWEMGDGTTVTCDGPGTPYDFDRPASAQSTDCSHLYQVAGDYDASATVTWAVSWSASGGAGGTLDAVERTSDFTMDVVERQAVGRR